MIKLGEYRNFRSDDYTPIGDVSDMYVALDRAYIRRYTDKLVSEYCKTGIIPTMNQIYARLYKDLDFKDYEEAQDENKRGVEVLSGRDIAKNIQNLCSFNMDDIDESFSKSKKKLRLRIDEKISENDYSQSKTGKAYKVFRIKNGKLYPPMVYNAGNKDTPIGVWLDAEAGEFIELDGMKRVIQKGGNKDKLMQRVKNLDNLSPEERKAELKSLKNATLAYRPGWHLGDLPRASQFDRKASWELLDELPEGATLSGNATNEDTLAKKATESHIDEYYYVKSLDKYAHIIGGEVYFPYDFIWAECDYVADIDYQDEAMSYGYRNGKKFQHSLAGLPRVPEGGSYKYRTNPKPDTVPWVITGAIKVSRLLDDFEVNKILGGNAPERQGGNKTLKELGF